MPQSRDSLRARPRVAGMAARGALAAVFLVALSCREDRSTLLPYPPSTIGVLEGYVRIGGRTTAAVVGARLADSPYSVVAYTQADANGWYHLALPSNLYWIEVAPRLNGFSSDTPRDTVRVEPEVRRFDVLRGTLTVRLTVPALANGVFFSGSLEHLSHSSSADASGPAQNGRLELHFALVAPGTYRVRLTSNGSQPFWLPGTSDIAQADPVRIGTLHPTAYEASLTGYCTLSGSVRGSWQEMAAARPMVTAHSLTPERLGHAFGAADGSFTLHLLQAQPCKLRVSIGNVDQWIGGDSFETATVFHPRRGRDLPGVALVEGGIFCQLDGPAAVPVPFARALVRDAAGRTLETDGGPDAIRFANLRAGSYKLYVYGECDSYASPWASQWYDGADSMAAATAVDVAAGRATHITMHLEPDGRIEGRILDAMGGPVAVSAAVYRDGLRLCNRTLYWAPGTFSLRGLGNGDYTIAALLDGKSWWYPGTADPQAASVLSIRNHARLSGIEWRLPPAAATEPR